MSECHPLASGPTPPAPGGTVTPPGHQTLPLGLSLVWGGLGPVLAAVLGAALYAGPIGDSTSAWSVLGVAALVATVAVGFVAVDANRQNTGIRWWHLLTASFAVGMIANALYGGTELILGAALRAFVTLAGLIALIVGAIIAVVQVSKRPTTAPTGPLVAPIVGYTADGKPVYGDPVRSQSTNVFAILALVFGILGGFLALIFGYIALSQIRRTGERGRGMALTGVILGYLYVVFALVFVVAGVSV